MAHNPDALGPYTDVAVLAGSGALGADYDIAATHGAPCRAIVVGTAGDVKLVTARGTTVTIPQACLTVGFPYRIQATKIVATGTSAQKILVLI